jgi:NACHT domain
VLLRMAHKVLRLAKWTWLAIILVFLISFAANVAVVRVTDASNLLIVAVIKWLFLPGINLVLTLSILIIITLISLFAWVITLLNAHERDNEVLDLYLNSLVKRNESITTKGIYQKTQALISVSIPLDEVFIQLQALCDRPLYDMPSEQRKLSEELLYRADLSEEEREERLQRQRTIWHSQLGRDFDGVQEIYSDNIIHHLSSEYPVAIVLGTPGSGKSTFLQWFALKMARACLKADYDIPENLKPKQIPILLRISDYTKQLARQEAEKPSFKDFLIQQASRIHTELPSRLFHELQSGHCLVLLDGLDEVTSDSMRRDVFESINDFVLEFAPIRPSLQPFNRFVFTSRIVGYDAGSFARYAHCTLEELDNDAIEDFLTKWCPAIERHQAMTFQGMKPLTPLQEGQLQTIGLEQKDDLLNIFDDRPSIKRLAVNPLLLTMLALVQRSKGDLPQRRIALYQIVTRTLLTTWNKESGRNYIEEISLAERILSDLAFQLHGTVLFLTEQAIKTVVSRAVREQTGSRAKAQDIQRFIDTIRSSSGLIIEIGQGLFSFMHRTFEEYYVALYILRMNSEALKQFVRQHYLEPIWHEPLLLAIAYKCEQSSREDHKEASELIQGILESGDEYDTVLYRNLLFAARSLAECRAWAVDKAIQQTIASHLLDLYADTLGKGRYTELQQEIEEVASRVLETQASGNNPHSPWPPFLKEWRTALCNDASPQRQLGASRLIATIAPDLSDCPQIVLHALVPPLVQLTRLSVLPLPSEVRMYLPQPEVIPAFQRIEEYAFMALCFLHAYGPIGWLDVEWDQWKEDHSEQLAFLKQRGNDLGSILPFFDIEKKLGSQKRRPRIATAKEVSEELLMSMRTLRQPQAYLLMQILEKEKTAPEASWRPVWDTFLQEEMNQGRSFMYQACLDLRLLLRSQGEQQIKEIADELMEALSKRGPQQAQVLITMTNIYLQQHVDLTEMSGLIGMPDLRRMRSAWTKWDDLDLHKMPGMRGLRELLILRYMRVILDRADLTQLVYLLDRDRIIKTLCNMLGEATNICASEILLCLYSLLTLYDSIPSDIKQQVEDSIQLFEQRIQSITAEDRMLMISIRQSINSPATTKAIPNTSTTVETPDNRAAALGALNELQQLTKAQVELLLTSCADMREVTEERNLEFGPVVRSIAWRLVERQYELDDEAFLAAINSLGNSNSLIGAAAALLLRRVKTPSSHLLKETANKIIALLSDEMLSSRPLDPPDYKYWRLDDILYEALKAIVG